MNLFFSTLGTLGWVGVGYYLHAGNNWASVACGLFSMFMGLASAMNAVGEELRKNGSSN